MSQLPNPSPGGESSSSRRTSSYSLEWSLRPAWRAVIFLAPIIAVSVWLSRVAIVVARVTYQTQTVSIPDISKAVNQDPNNADLIHRLGYVYSSSPTDSDIGESVKFLRKATVMNPRRWDYWQDLGQACDIAGDVKCSDEAFERTLALNPMAPSVQWAVGNHFLLTDRENQAFPYFRRLLDMDPNYLEPTLRLCLRATHDPETIYQQVVPHGKDPSGRVALLMVLNSAADYESALRIWGQMISGPDRTPDLTLVAPFVDSLIDHNQVQDAGIVWDDLQRAGVIPANPASQAGSLLYDGGFEGAPLNVGFDWRVSDSPELETDFADPSAYKGSKCLRIKFVVGVNGNYDLVNQAVRVKPNTQYDLTAYVRSDNLTSQSGPRLRVIELGCDNCQTRTSDPTLGTTDWHPVDVTFVTEAQTQAVRISFWRPADQVAHEDITGTVWLDEVALRVADSTDSSVNRARPH